MKYVSLVLLMLVFAAINVHSQYTTDKVVGDKHAAVRDSLKTAAYPYMLPIWGQKVVNKGFKIPLPAGLSMQYIWQESDIVIDNLQVGFNHGPKYSLDQIVRFDKAVTSSSGVNIRPDIWLFPFLNIYALFAKSNTSTTINAGVYVPDSSSWNKIFDINTQANFDATTFGFGLTPTVGIGGYFLAIDMNFSWTDIDELDDPAYVFVLGPRLGKNFAFKGDRSLAVWAGGFRVKLNSGTNGSLSATDLFPLDQWQAKIDTGYMKIASSQQQVDAWWAGLSPQEQRNPVNVAKHEAADGVLARAGNVLNAASGVVSDAADGSIQYSLDKKPKDKWNFIIGSQFQINKNWMIRAEMGFLGSRQQFIGGVQYRLGF